MTDGERLRKMIGAGLFILLTWGVIIGAAAGAGFFTARWLGAWYWGTVAGLIILVAGAIFAEWLSRGANVIVNRFFPE